MREASGKKMGATRIILQNTLTSLFSAVTTNVTTKFGWGELDLCFLDTFGDQGLMGLVGQRYPHMASGSPALLKGRGFVRQTTKRPK